MALRRYLKMESVCLVQLQLYPQVKDKEKKSVWNGFHVEQLHFMKNVLQTYYHKLLSSCLIF